MPISCLMSSLQSYPVRSKDAVATNNRNKIEGVHPQDITPFLIDGMFVILRTLKKNNTYMKQIKVLVSGCQCSRKFYDLVVKVVKENGIEAEVLMVDDIMEIMQYNTMTLPSLVVDEKLVARGQQSEAAIKSLLI